MKRRNQRVGITRRFPALFAAAVFLGAPFVHADKQRLILLLRDPLRPVTSEVILPAVTNAHGETRDLKTVLQLADTTATAATPGQASRDTAQLTLGMTVKSLGPHQVWVRITLPQPADVEVLLLDLYGKNLGTLFAGQCPRGEMILQPELPKEINPRGLKLVALRVDGNIVTRQVIAQVK